MKIHHSTLAFNSFFKNLSKNNSSVWLIQIKSRIRSKFTLPTRKVSSFFSAVREARWADNSTMAIGKTYLETREALDKRATAKVQVTQFEAPYRIAYKSRAAGVTGEYVYRLLETNDATYVTLKAFVEASGLARLIWPVFTSAINKSDSNQLAAMKYFLERT